MKFYFKSDISVTHIIEAQSLSLAWTLLRIQSPFDWLSYSLMNEEEIQEYSDACDAYYANVYAYNSPENCQDFL